MSARDSAAAAAVARVATACDGAVLGLVLAYVTAHSWAKYISSSSALRRIRAAPSPHLSGLRSLLSDGDDGDGPLVVIRGTVQTAPSSDRAWTSVSPLISDSGHRAVVVQLTQTCLYNEWRGIFGWSFDLHALFAKSWKEQRSCSTRSIPFNLVESDAWLNSAYATVSLDGSDHPLPLTTVYHHLHPVQPTPYTFLQALFGDGYPIALLDEEKILPVGQDITAVGICRTRGGTLEIKSCGDLPCFLSDMTKDEIEADLASRTNFLFWCVIVIGTLSVGILSYSISRNWLKWKDWRERRRRQTQELQNEVPPESGVDEESGDVPDGELCVVCLMRRRRSAFVPCGHLVCCPRCALAVERDSSPKCPVCRQSIRSAIRIYDS